jgi:Tfp pilus assembly protein PilX
MAMNLGTILRHKRASSLTRESGIALIMALICLAVISTLAVGVMFSTQSEIWTSSNYRATTQARYLAEAGAQQAINYIQTTYAPPSNFTAATFNLNTVPVTTVSGSQPLILATSGMTAPYTDTYSAIDTTQETAFQSYFATATTQTAFASMASGAHFDVGMQLLSAYQGTDGKWLMRWKIVSEGAVNKIGTTLTNSGNARVQVVEVVDNVVTYTSGSSSSSSPTYAAGVFATGKGCGAITMSGGQYTNSYNSTTQLGVTSPSLANTGGDVATYGNVTITNGAYIIGNVFTPFYNLGTTGTYGIAGGPTWPGLNSPTSNAWSAKCSTASGGTEWAVYEDNSGSSVGCTAASSGSCSQKTYALPSPAPSYPTPCLPSGNCTAACVASGLCASVVPATVTANTATCSGYNGLCSGGNGGGSGCAITIPPSTLPNGSAGTGAANFGTVNFGSCAVITLQAGTYNMDSLLVSNGAKIVLPSTGSVVINILDQGTATNPLNVNGGIVANNGGAPANFTFVYGGTKTLNLAAGANMFASVYAPNAPVSLSGNAGLYGAIVTNTATFSGSGHVIYDTSLGGQKWNINTGSTVGSVTGTLHVDEFSWSAF